MLTELHAWICRHLRAAGFTAWADDCVPEQADFPFIAFRFEPAAAFGAAGALHLTLWQSAAAPRGELLAAADTLLRIVPPEGLLLRLTDGAALITRSQQSDPACRKKNGARTASLRFNLQLYPSGKE